MVKEHGTGRCMSGMTKACQRCASAGVTCLNAQAQLLAAETGTVWRDHLQAFADGSNGRTPSQHATKPGCMSCIPAAQWKAPTTARHWVKMMLAAANGTRRSDSSRPRCCSAPRQAMMQKRSAASCWPLAQAARHFGKQKHQAGTLQCTTSHTRLPSKRRGMPSCSHMQVQVMHAHNAPMTQ